MRIDLNKLEAEMCKRSLSHFVRTFWSVIIPDPLQWGSHMDILCDEVQAVYERVINRQPKMYDLIINISPSSTKSTIATVMAPVWSWTRDAGLRHITISYSQDLSTEHAVKSRDIVKSELYQRLFPNVELKKDEDGKTNYKTTKGGQRFATSIRGTITGVHAHVQTVDDPVSPKQMNSAIVSLEANKFFDETLPSRKVDADLTPLILIMQRLSTTDPTGHLLGKGKTNIRHVCLPAELTKDVKPEQYRNIYVDGIMDPRRLSRATLKNLKLDLGAYNYAGQYLQTPSPEGGEIWQKWFIAIPDHLFPDRRLLEKYGTDWDTAYTDDEDNAANAYVTAGRLNGRVYIDDIGWKWCEFPELIKFMREKPAPHYIEAKASGKSAKQTLSKAGIPTIEVKANSGDKVAKARSVTPYAEAGMVCVRSSILNDLYNDEKQGLLLFPKSKWKDLADAFAQSLTRLRTKAGIISTSGGSVDDDPTVPTPQISEKNMLDNL